MYYYIEPNTSVVYTLLQSQVFINCGIFSILDGLIFMDLWVPLCTYQSPPPPVNYKIQSLFYIYTKKSLKMTSQGTHKNLICTKINPHKFRWFCSMCWHNSQPLTNSLSQIVHSYTVTNISNKWNMVGLTKKNPNIFLKIVITLSCL